MALFTAQLLSCARGRGVTALPKLLQITSSASSHACQVARPIWTEIEPQLSVNPKLSLVDEGLVIEASGLPRDQHVTIRAEAEIEGVDGGRLVSLGCYVADQDGCISTSRHPSLAGTYRGVEPLGPMWSMQQQPHPTSNSIAAPPTIRHRPPSQPMVVKFSLLNGHVDRDHTREDVMVEGCEIERAFIMGNIQRSVWEQGELEAAMYVPADRGPSPLPAVLDFRSAEEDNREHMAALLASHGYVTMTTKFPSPTSYLDIKCLEGLFDHLSSHPMVDDSRIGVLARGDGVTIGMGLAAYLPHLPLKCLVGINGVTFNTSFGWRLQDGKTTSFFPYYEKGQSLKCLKKYRNGALSLCDQFSPFWPKSILRSVPDAFIPVQNISVPMRMFHSVDNPYLPTDTCMQDLQDRLREGGNGDLLDLRGYQGTGHLLDPSHPSHIRASSGSIPGVTDGSLVLWGGETAAHARCQKHMWEKTLHFLKLHLGPN